MEAGKSGFMGAATSEGFMVAAIPLGLTYLQRGLFYGETPAEVNMYTLSGLGLYDDYGAAMRNPYFIAGQGGGNAGWTFASMATFINGLPTSLNISSKPVGVPVMTPGGALAGELVLNVPAINVIGGSTELVLIGTAGLVSNWSMMSGGGSGEAGSRSKISSAEIRIIEKHLHERFGPDKPNDAMIQRLKAGEWTSWDQSFAEHELLEARLMDAGLDWETAHPIVLRQQGISHVAGYEAYLYHPDVIEALPNLFNKPTRILSRILSG